MRVLSVLYVGGLGVWGRGLMRRLRRLTCVERQLEPDVVDRMRKGVMDDEQSV
jgi:hypothetical protein